MPPAGPAPGRLVRTAAGVGPDDPDDVTVTKAAPGPDDVTVTEAAPGPDDVTVGLTDLREEDTTVGEDTA